MNIEQIKLALREHIRISESPDLTPAPWTDDGTGYMWHKYYAPDQEGFEGEHVIFCRTKNADFDFIASARSFTPRAAKMLLTTIEALESLHANSPMEDDSAWETLETICREWEESK